MSGYLGSRKFARWPAVPANNGTRILFTTHPRQPGGTGDIEGPTCDRSGKELPPNADMVTVTWHRHNKASATGGLKAYALDQNDVWRETDMKSDADAATMPKTVPALAAGAEWTETFLIGRFRGWCLEETVGADNPEDFDGTVCVDWGCQVVTR